MKKAKQRNGVPSDMAKLDFHDWFGRLQDRFKAKVTEKEKGMLMMDKLMDRFGITPKEHSDFRAKALAWNTEVFSKESIERREKAFGDHPPIFKRDSEGKIISPFDKK